MQAKPREASECMVGGRPTCRGAESAVISSRTASLRRAGGAHCTDSTSFDPSPVTVAFDLDRAGRRGPNLAILWRRGNSEFTIGIDHTKVTWCGLCSPASLSGRRQGLIEVATHEWHLIRRRAVLIGGENRVRIMAFGAPNREHGVIRRPTPRGETNGVLNAPPSHQHMGTRSGQ